MGTIFSPLDLRQTLEMARTLSCLASTKPHEHCHGCVNSIVSVIGISPMDGGAGSSCVFLACIQPDVVGAFVGTMSQADQDEYRDHLAEKIQIPLPCVKAYLPFCKGKYSEKTGCDF